MTSETKQQKKVEREKPIPEGKKKEIEMLVEKISSNRTVLLASCKSLPGQQFHEIKKKLREKAEVKVAKKTAISRAIDEIDKGAIKNIKEKIGADIVLMFSNLDPFELSGILTENQSPAKARAGDIAPEDIEIEPGPTDLPPGPAISELGSVGLKVAVKDGKLEIMQGATVAKAGEEIKDNVASVLAKLDVTPMKVGFLPVAAYDSKEDKFYVDIKIDKEGTLEALREMLGKALGLAVGVGYVNKETIGFILGKAAAEEQALSKLVKEEKTEEPKKEEPEEKKEEGKEEPVNDKTEDKSEQPGESEEKVADKNESESEKDAKEEA